jgi:hypothetical protein
VIRGEATDAVYGVSTAALTDEYERDAPFAYPPLDPCPYPLLPEVDDGVWRERITISYDNPEATQFESVENSANPAAAVFRRLDLEAGTYAFELNNGGDLR